MPDPRRTAQPGDGTSVRATAHAVPVDSVHPTIRLPGREILEPDARSWTLGATLFSVFGLLALIVATIGLYSVLAFDVAQRTKEIGIRSPLGARRGQVLGEVLARGGPVAAAGCGLGLGVAFLVAPTVQPLLIRVQARDSLVLAIVG